MLLMPPIVMDGSFDDWAAVRTALVDPVDATREEIDFGSVQVSASGDLLDIALDLGREVNLQGLRGRMVLLIDSDGKVETGAAADEEKHLPGADWRITFSPRDPRQPDRPGGGVRAERLGADAPQATDRPARQLAYELGLHFAPTHSSPRCELRLSRREDFLAGAQAKIRFIAYRPDESTADTTDSISIELPPAAPATSPTQASDPLARAPGTALRVMAWNTEFGAILEDEQIFARVLSALRPDIVLLEEQNKNCTEAALKEFFAQVPAPGADPTAAESKWNVLVGREGGDLHCALVTHLPLHEMTEIEPIGPADELTRAARTAGAAIDAGEGRKVLALAIHLKCCGRLGDDSDLTREREAGAIAAALRSARRPDIAGVVIGGDLNLVGGPRPLRLLAAGSDLDGTDLEVASPLQLDGRSAVTWSDAKSPFTPGRLDYLLYSGSRLTLLHSFVLDTADLSESWLKHHKLEAGDTREASDHLPVVIDLSWR